MSFDVFGARRDAQSWALKHTEASSGLLSSALTLRGYTGHEQIDDVGLVHMGGRVYDPILGRFLQADPFVQQPNNTQNLNRYSYVLNNPLNATDPSGYFFQMLAMWAVQYIAAATATSAIGTALGVALQAYSYYGYAQMAVEAIRAIEGGGTAMANFAGGMAKGFAKGAIFRAAMAGLTNLANSGQEQVGSVDGEQGNANTDGNINTNLSDSTSGELKTADIKVRTDALTAGIDKLYKDGTLKDANFFEKHEDAAKHVLTAVTPLSKDSKLEVGGNIEEVSLGDKKYYRYTRPVIGTENSVNVSGHAIGYHTHPSGEINFSNLFTAMKNGGNADTEWIRVNGKGLYVGVMQGGVVKISFCGHNSTCSRDTSTDGAKGKVIK